MNNDLISRSKVIEELNYLKYIGYDNSGVMKLQNMEIQRCISVIEDTPTVEIPTELCKGCRFLKDCETCEEKLRPQGELADEVWKLYEKHHSHLATHVIEFGDELKELLDKYQKGGAE